MPGEHHSRIEDVVEDPHDAIREEVDNIERVKREIDPAGIHRDEEVDDDSLDREAN